MFHFSGSRVHNPMYSGYDDNLLKLSGYPIRIPPDLSSLAAPRGFSQLAASFFACWHQGIHHKPLSSSFTRMRSTPGDSLNFENYRESFACMLDSCVSLFLEIVFSHKIVGVLIFIRICNFATRMSICSFFLTALFTFERDIRLIGLEPMTPRLSSACSNRLSYSRLDLF